MDTRQTDVIVCGSGLAGLSASVTAAEAGAAVTLVEKAPELGGTTALSGGLLWTFADYDELRSKIPDGDPALQWLVLDTIEESRRWLAAQGVRLAAATRVHGHGVGTEFAPSEAIAKLRERLGALGGRILVSHPMTRILMAEGAVAGVSVLRDGRTLDVRARAVVLATGGFQGNRELLARYVVTDSGNLALRASPWSTGDGFLAATEIGAAASPGLGTFYGHALAWTGRYRRNQLSEASQFQGSLAVAMNMNGDRFVDESAGTGEEVINQRLARQPGGRGFYITDEAMMEMQPMPGRPSIVRTVLARARGIGSVILEAATLEELCQRMAEFGVPAWRSLATLQEFNAAMQPGGPDRLHPPRKANRLVLATPPFRAVPVQAGITISMGGIQIDEKTRVLWRAGSSTSSLPPPAERAFMPTDGPAVAIGAEYRQTAIHGLYAAGSDAGNISCVGYMGGLATALTTGRTAGAQAARG